MKRDGGCLLDKSFRIYEMFIYDFYRTDILLYANKLWSKESGCLIDGKIPVNSPEKFQKDPIKDIRGINYFVNDHPYALLIFDFLRC